MTTNLFCFPVIRIFQNNKKIISERTSSEKRINDYAKEDYKHNVNFEDCLKELKFRQTLASSRFLSNSFSSINSESNSFYSSISKIATSASNSNVSSKSAANNFVSKKSLSNSFVQNKSASTISVLNKSASNSFVFNSKSNYAEMGLPINDVLVSKKMVIKTGNENNQIMKKNSCKVVDFQELKKPKEKSGKNSAKQYTSLIKRHNHSYTYDEFCDINKGKSFYENEYLLPHEYTSINSISTVKQV
ncbi:uncharacterized protein LOC124817224 isoform X2 [Hydra vulgaris]|uniref:Uncharacterized protein LOC124817224 isoform X2 n=1 Tax=Hydra vulgaris TaxID=6087 RepID=A0ABM4CFB5_HYDVU